MKHDAMHPSQPDAWIEQTFDVPAVRNGGIFRTSVQAVEAGIGMERFADEIHRRNFRALENRGHIVVFCNTEPVAILNPKASVDGVVSRPDSLKNTH